MKKIIFLLFIALTTSFTSCSDDDKQTGTLHIHFDTTDAKRKVSICPPEMDYYLASFGSEQDIKIELNMGNYAVHPYNSNDGGYWDITVQVRPNKTTFVNYSKSHPTVSY